MSLNSVIECISKIKTSTFYVSVYLVKMFKSQIFLLSFLLTINSLLNYKKVVPT